MSQNLCVRWPSAPTRDEGDNAFCNVIYGATNVWCGNLHFAMSVRSILTAGKARRIQNSDTVAAPVKLKPLQNLQPSVACEPTA